MDRLTVLLLKFLECFHRLQTFLWWVLELHVIKVVSSYIIWVSVKEASDTAACCLPEQSQSASPLPSQPSLML